MKNIFELNYGPVHRYEIQGSPIFVFEDFYKYPQELLYSLKDVPLIKWKEWEHPSLNGKFFLDQSYEAYHPGMIEVYRYLSSFCKCTPERSPDFFTGNHQQFFDKDFNNFENNYWWPHKDTGFTGILDLNEKSTATNLYCEDHNDPDPFTGKVTEHMEPWRSKSKWKLLHRLEAKFNRLTLFDANKFFHGMAVDDYSFFEQPRINQAIFFNKCENPGVL